MSIITKRGDDGETDLLFARRIPKSSLRVEALGCVDELNAALGLARAAGSKPEVIDLIDGIQQRLIGLMGELACLPQDAARYADKNYAAVGDDDVKWLEDVARKHEDMGIRFTGWATPGAEGSIARAGLDFARAVARRSERTLWRLHESGEPVSAATRLFFNRLSDLLWILARVAKPPGLSNRKT